MTAADPSQPLSPQKVRGKRIFVAAFLGFIGFILMNEFHVIQPVAESFASMNSLGGTINSSGLNQRVLPSFPDKPQNQTCSVTSCSVNLTASCLAPGCVEQVAAGMARVYSERDENRSWCATGGGPTGYDTETGKWRGVLLTKNPKAASTTAAGVAIRLATRNGNCHVQHYHVRGTRYEKRDPETSFLFTSVRDPAKRAISSIFYKPVSQNGNDPTDDFLLKHLKISEHELHGTISKEYAGFQTRYTSVREWNGTPAWTPRSSILHPARVEAQVREIVNAYDFILVVERMEESLVAMAILLGVDVGDVLVTSSNQSGAYSILLTKGAGRRCHKIQKSFVSPAVKAYLNSDVWRAKNYGDYLLHAAATMSLDRTIEAIGRERFDKELAEYRRLRALEREICAPFVNFPCSKDGEPQTHLSKNDCYLASEDVGCGYRCIDSLINNQTRPTQIH